jgi:hypothetical protein
MSALAGQRSAGTMATHTPHCIPRGGAFRPIPARGERVVRSQLQRRQAVPGTQRQPPQISYMGDDLATTATTQAQPTINEGMPTGQASLVVSALALTTMLSMTGPAHAEAFGGFDQLSNNSAAVTFALFAMCVPGKSDRVKSSCLCWQESCGLKGGRC